MKRLFNARLTAVLMSLAMVAAVAAIPFGKVAADGGVPINEDTFPDPMFRDYVRGKFNQDEDEDFLSDEEISNAKCITYDDMEEYIDIGTVGAISDYTGIEKLTSLEDLATEGELDKLDLSKNTALVSLGVYGAHLSSLDLSANTKLETLCLSGNNFRKLDLSSTPNVERLVLSYNEIEELDISKLTSLNMLDCSDNKLTDLDISKNTALVTLWCSDNRLTSLDLKNNTQLEVLGCNSNQLTSLDTGNNEALSNLYCGSNKLKTLDISKNEYLTSLQCTGNYLKTLDISRCPNLVETYTSGEKTVHESWVYWELEWDWIYYTLACDLNVEIKADLPPATLSKVPQANNLVANGKAQALITAGVAVDGILEYAIGKSATNAPYNINDWSEKIPTGTDAKTYYVWYRVTADDYHTDIEPKCIVVKIAKPTSTPTATATPKPSIKLNKTSANVVCGKTVQLRATVTNSTAAVKWTSSNKKIATVDSKGKVKGLMAGSVTITAIVSGQTAKCKIQVLYKDVKDKSEFWFTPTNDLTNKGIVKGYDNQTKFIPNNECTRAQMVTFLYRLKGEPKIKNAKNTFKDVEKGRYYYNAVLWASSKGITTGYKGGLFKPSEVCTRAQTVTFLWRMAGKPAPKATKCKFTDVKKSDYFFKPVIWASEMQIVAGYEDGTFKPEGKCLRRQMVTFLYKYDKYVQGN